MEIVIPDPDGRTINDSASSMFHTTLSIATEVSSILALFSVWQSYLELVSNTSTGSDTAIILEDMCVIAARPPVVAVAEPFVPVCADALGLLGDG